MRITLTDETLRLIKKEYPTFTGETVEELVNTIVVVHLANAHAARLVIEQHQPVVFHD